MQRIRVVAAFAAAGLITLAIAPVAGVVDRVLPHEVQPWDQTVCTPSTSQDHALIGLTGPVPERGAPVTILEVRPLGIQHDVGWRAWVLPAGRIGTAGTRDPDAPPGWSERTTPGEAARATADRPVQLLMELWPLHGDHPTAMHGVLVRYRTASGLVRQAITPTSVTTRPGGCT